MDQAARGAYAIILLEIVAFTKEKSAFVIKKLIIKKVIGWCLKPIMGVFMEKIIARIVQEIINRLSPEMKDAIKQAVVKLETSAAATENPWDDLAVQILKAALNIS